MMRPTGWELYNNLELFIERYQAAGLPAAKTRLHGIALMIHEIRAVNRSQERCRNEMNMAYKNQSGKYASKDKWNKLRHVKRMATLKASLDAYDRYEERAWPVIQARLDKLPLVFCDQPLRKRPNNRYLKKVFTWHLQIRRFSFWDPIS